MQDEQAAVTGEAAASVTQNDPFGAALAELEKAWPEFSGESAEGTDAAPTGTVVEAPSKAPEPDETTPEYWRRLYEERDTAFKGLQGTVQKLTEAERRREAEAEAAKEQQFQAQLAYMPQDQRELVLAHRQAAEVAAAGRHALEVAEVGAKAQVITILAGKYGIDPTDLAECRSADEMERLAARIHRERQAAQTTAREARQAERAETGADAFGHGVSGVKLPNNRVMTIDEAGDELVRVLRGRRP